MRQASKERFWFLSHGKFRVTKRLEKTIFALRGEMSVSAISDYCDLDWNTVKAIEKRKLAADCAHVPLDKTEAIGIDEIQAFPSARGGLQYVTVVRNRETGDVLFVADGKGADARTEFGRRIHRWRRRIKCVCMDMSNACAKWVRTCLPNAQIVYDHFHVIKAMNDRLDAVRRRRQTRRGQQRLGRGLQQQDPMADNAGLRIARQGVLQDESILAADPEDVEIPMKIFTSAGRPDYSGSSQRSS